MISINGFIFREQFEENKSFGFMKRLKRRIEFYDNDNIFLFGINREGVFYQKSFPECLNGKPFYQILNFDSPYYVGGLLNCNGIATQLSIKDSNGYRLDKYFKFK